MQVLFQNKNTPPACADGAVCIENDAVQSELIHTNTTELVIICSNEDWLIVQAYWIRTTACPSYGGMRLLLAIGAVCPGRPLTCQTPDSGHTSPVFASVPNGFIVLLLSIALRMYEQNAI
jgi:hypothetical protein